NLANSDSGVSPDRGARATTAFMNGGEPGGQSTGMVRQRVDCSKGWSENSCRRAIAARTIAGESPRFEPRAMIARCGDFTEVNQSLLTSAPTAVILARAHPACRRARAFALSPIGRRGGRLG